MSHDTSRRVAALAVALLATLWAPVGCDRASTIRDSDLREVRRLIETGLGHPDDPYVRAETLRLLRLSEDPRLAARAKPLLEDSRAMVRVAALRCFFAVDRQKAEGRATRQFGSAETTERRAILEAALDFGSTSFQKDLMWRALRPTQDRELRRFALEEALRPRVLRALDEGETSFVDNQFVPRAREWIRRLDTEVGGLVLPLLRRADVTEPARRLASKLKSDATPLRERLRAADILLEAREPAAEPVYRGLLKRDSGSDSSETSNRDGDTRNRETSDPELAVPEARLDPRLIQNATLGLASLGDRGVVPRAKRYLENASSSEYRRVLRALAPNPSEPARLALRNAMADARPQVRNTAIRLYAGRDDASLQAILGAFGRLDSGSKTRGTRRAVGTAIGRHFAQTWRDRLKRRLSTNDRTVEALTLTRAMFLTTESTETIEAVAPSLRKLAASENPTAADLSGFLLAKLPDLFDRPKLLQLLHESTGVETRYALLERLVGREPEAHVEFFVDNLYTRKGAPESFGVRLLAGIGLWRVADAEATAPHAGPKESRRGDDG